MGADLYIKSIQKETNAKYKPFFNLAVTNRNFYQKLGMTNLAEEAQKEVSKYYDLMYSEGYFRDSYNGSALFQYLYLTNPEGKDETLSWWRDVIPLTNNKNEIKGKNLEKFLTIILAAELRLPTKEQLIANKCKVDESGEDSIEGWHKFLQDKHQRLIELISQAIEMDEPIYASL
jgi:hypothetical protein